MRIKTIRFRCSFFLLAIFSTAILSAQTEGVQLLDRLGDVFRTASEAAEPAIVHIESTRIRPVSPSKSSGRSVKMQVEETGSGIIVESGGKRVIITNRHVVEDIDLDSIMIRSFDRRILTPTRVRTNAEFDLAVVEVAETLEKTAAIGDSDRVRTGDVILAVGSPYGLERSVSMGIVSAVDRRRIPAATVQTPICGFFQIDAAVNPGSSGGPMLSGRGEVVGMITAIATQGGGNEGVAFAIPIKQVLRIADQLVQGDLAVRPYIGLGFDPAFGVKEHRELGLDRMVGARIQRIQPDSPAATAGLKAGDVILSFNETEIEDDQHVIDLVARSEINQPIALQALRNGQLIRLSITPGSQISR